MGKTLTERIKLLELELEATQDALKETTILLQMTIKDLAKRHGWAMSNFSKVKKLKAELAALKGTKK